MYILVYVIPTSSRLKAKYVKITEKCFPIHATTIINPKQLLINE